MRARRAVLIAAALLAVVGVAGSAAPAGAATAPPKAMVLSATPVTTVWSQATKLSLSLTPKGGGTPKGGTITFRTGDTVLGTATATKRITTFNASTLPVGANTVTADYSGDGATGPATSNSIVVTVSAAPTATTLATTAATVTTGERAELKATVKAKSPANGQIRPTGTVTFTAGTVTGTVRVNSTGVATWRPLLAEGTHEVTATYSGSDTHAASTSAAVSQVVAPETPPAPVGELDAGNPNTQGGLGAAATVAQTFTAVRSGLLTKIGIAFNYDGPDVTVALYNTANGVPTGEPHSPKTVPTRFIYPGLNEIVLDTPFPVTAGTQYAIVITPPNTQNNIGYRTTSDWGYTGGSAYLRWPWDTSWGRSYGIDIGFQTWVAPTAD